MVNLLAVIISVALTVVMSAAGMVYLGNTFTSAGPKAAANQVISALSQIDASWILYSSNGGTTTLAAAGSTFPTMTGAATATDLVGAGYLTAVPTALSSATTWGGGAAGYALDLTNPATATGVTAAGMAGQYGAIFIVLPSTAMGSCVAIAQASGQLGAAAVTAGTVSSVATFNTAFTGFKFGCVQVTASGSLTFNNLTGNGGTDTGKLVAYFKY
jgi:hypothetical protein